VMRGGKGVFAQNLSLFFFFFSLSLFHLYFTEAQCHTAGPYTDGAEKEHTGGGRLPHNPYGRTFPETDWRDLVRLTVPDNRNRPRGNWNICLSSLSLSPSSLTLSLSLYRILPSSIFHRPPLPPPLFISFSPPHYPTPSHHPSPFAHPPPAMDNSHDYPGHPNSCIPSVVPPGVDPSLVDFREFYPYIPNEIKHRKRTTQAQLEILEETFAHDKKPNGVMRANLARQLDMTPRGVQVGSQNLPSPRFTILTCLLPSIHRFGFRTGVPLLNIPSSSRSVLTPHFFSSAGGRKKRRWQKRLPPNSSTHNHHRLTLQSRKRVLARVARLHCSGAPRRPRTTTTPPSLLLPRQLTVPTRPKILSLQPRPSPPFDTT